MNNHKVISVENLIKQYDLGVIGTGTLSRDLNRWWARVRKQPDPYSTIGHKDAFERVGESILALDGISFTVNQGEALGIIGKNGAGKSTLLKILSRVTAPTSGSVKVKGRIGSLLEVGTGFHPELTGRENVYLNGAILGMRKDEVTRKFDEIVAFSGVEKFIDTPVKRYSSGMYVRLAFAVAAHLDPEILIVDEVLAVGDAEFQKKCLGKMGDVASEGRTVLFVSHNLVAIRNLCQRCILLGEGKILVNGDTDRTIEVYSSKPVDGIAHNGNLNLFRPSWAKPFISRVELKNIKGETSNTFLSGETIIIELSFNNLEGHKIKKPVMGLALVNKKSGIVGKVNTRITGFEVYDFGQQSAIFVASLKDLPLTAGSYCFNVYLGDGEADIDALIDILDFSIIPTDYYGTGKISTYDPGNIYISPEWKLLNE